jgi:drug/metabolite transporter (DMT)-like permease
VDALTSPPGLAGIYFVLWCTDRTRDHAALCALLWGIMVLFVTALDWGAPWVGRALERKRHGE